MDKWSTSWRNYDVAVTKLTSFLYWDSAVNPQLTVLAFVSGISSSGSQSLFLYYVEERIGFDDSDVASKFMCSSCVLE